MAGQVANTVEDYREMLRETDGPLNVREWSRIADVSDDTLRNHMDEIEAHDAVRSKVLSRTRVYWWDGEGDERGASGELEQTLTVAQGVAVVLFLGALLFALSHSTFVSGVGVIAVAVASGIVGYELGS
ncbi:hypothetical protein [Halogeometricum luteum]|uniref:HTH domain-containing protein n=1 Tax=Halogeometricum luteum TaxID=2950537 RepID=A0ABU2G8J1_9EURY|nr:hypothetical protein [Halogeometricum sp. S3BR5-2]MDS0297112.1 hypothetical protein [Halogeometricum sp. S3BR5-2]